MSLSAVLVVLGAGVIVQYGDGGAREGADEAARTAQWLTVHYASMDNNLDAFGEWQADLHSLEQVGSSPDSVHIALYDGLGPNNTPINPRPLTNPTDAIYWSGLDATVVEPGTRLPYKDEYVAGYAYQLRPNLAVEIRGRRVPARVVDRPFYRRPASGASHATA